MSELVTKADISKLCQRLQMSLDRDYNFSRNDSPLPSRIILTKVRWDACKELIECIPELEFSREDLDAVFNPGGMSESTFRKMCFQSIISYHIPTAISCISSLAVEKQYDSIEDIEISNNSTYLTLTIPASMYDVLTLMYFIYACKEEDVGTCCIRTSALRDMGFSYIMDVVRRMRMAAIQSIATLDILYPDMLETIYSGYQKLIELDSFDFIKYIKLQQTCKFVHFKDSKDVITLELNIVNGYMNYKKLGNGLKVLVETTAELVRRYNNIVSELLCRTLDGSSRDMSVCSILAKYADNLLQDLHSDTDSTTIYLAYDKIGCVRRYTDVESIQNQDRIMVISPTEIKSATVKVTNSDGTTVLNEGRVIIREDSTLVRDIIGRFVEIRRRTENASEETVVELPSVLKDTGTPIPELVGPATDLPVGVTVAIVEGKVYRITIREMRGRKVELRRLLSTDEIDEYLTVSNASAGTTGTNGVTNAGLHTQNAETGRATVAGVPVEDINAHVVGTVVVPRDAPRGTTVDMPATFAALAEQIRRRRADGGRADRAELQGQEVHEQRGTEARGDARAERDTRAGERTEEVIQAQMPPFNITREALGETFNTAIQEVRYPEVDTAHLPEVNIPPLHEVDPTVAHVARRETVVAPRTQPHEDRLRGYVLEPNEEGRLVFVRREN